MRAFVSRDGRAILHITAGPIAAGLTVPEVPPHGDGAAVRRATYDYSPQQSHWFVLSGTRGNDMFYERITFSCDGALHGWQLTYPVAERAFYDRVVEEMHRGYRHSNGPGARCGEGKRETQALPNPPAGLATPQAGRRVVRRRNSSGMAQTTATPVLLGLVPGMQTPNKRRSKPG